MFLDLPLTAMYITQPYHDHLTEELRDINAEGHACNDLLDHLDISLQISLDLWVP